VAGKNPGVVVEHEEFGDDRVQQVPAAATGQVGAADGLFEQGIAGECQRTESRFTAGVGHPEHDRSAGVSRGVVDRHDDAAEVEGVAVAVEFDDLSGFAEQCAESELADSRSEALDRIGQHEPVGRVDERRASVGVGHLLRRPDVVDMSMGE